MFNVQIETNRECWKDSNLGAECAEVLRAIANSIDGAAILNYGTVKDITGAVCAWYTIESEGK